MNPLSRSSVARAALPALLATVLSASTPALAQLTLADTTPPTVTVESPAAGTLVAGEVVITASASDGLGTGVAGVDFQSGTTAGAWTPLSYQLLSGTWRGSWDVTALPDGSRALYVRARDHAGNVRIATVSVVIAQPPAAPSGLTVTAPAAPSNGGRLDVAWSPNGEPDVAGYFVYRSNAYGGPYARVANVTGTALADTAISNGTAYYYQVSAYDRSGNESRRTAAAVGTAYDTRAPAVSAVTVTLPSSTEAQLSWTTDEAATSQVLYGETEALGSATPVASARTSHQVTLSGLKAGTTYHYRVRAVDAAGNTTQSEPGTFSTRVNQAPTVTLVSPADGAVITGPARLQAQAADDVAVTRAEWTYDGISWSPLAHNDLTGFFEADLAGVPEGQHPLAVRVFDEAGLKAQQVIQVTFDRQAPTVEILAPVLDAHLPAGTPHTFEFDAKDATLTAVDWQILFVPVGVEVETTPDPDPAAWQPAALNGQTGHHEVAYTTPLVVTETIAFVYARATDASGRQTVQAREVTILANGVDFSFIGAGGQELFGTVAIEPIAPDGTNVIGIQVLCRTCTPGGSYSLTVSGPGGAHTARFTADGRGRGDVVVEEGTALVDEFSATLTPGGPGF